MTREEQLKQKAKILKNPERYNVIFSANQSGFSDEDYREIKRVVIERVIKQPNINDWKIENILTMNGVYGRQEDTVLIHKLARLKYDDDGILVQDLGKIHYKKAFDDEEWAEIEQILSEISDEQQNPQVEQLPKKSWWERGREIIFFRGFNNKH